MHRTQILLEEWQYDALKTAADRRGLSMSEVLREIVSAHLKPKKRGREVLEQIEGIASDPGSIARDHDSFLYGKKKKTRR
jgi:hypothetical protein